MDESIAVTTPPTPLPMNSAISYLNVIVWIFRLFILEKVN